MQPMRGHEEFLTPAQLEDDQPSVEGAQEIAAQFVGVNSEAVQNPSRYQLGEMFSNASPELQQRAHALLIRFDGLRETNSIAPLAGDDGLDPLQEMAVRVALIGYDNLEDLKVMSAEELVGKLEQYMEAHWSEDLPMAA